MGTSGNRDCQRASRSAIEELELKGQMPYSVDCVLLSADINFCSALISFFCGFS